MRLTLLFALLSGVHASQLWGSNRMRTGVGKSVYSIEPEQFNMQPKPRKTERLHTERKLNSEYITKEHQEDYRPFVPFSPDSDQLKTSSSILHCKSILGKRRARFLFRPHHRVQEYSPPGPLFLTIPQPPQQACAPSAVSGAKSSHA